MISTEVIHDPFSEDYEMIAAYARQMMRAHRAKDSKALELEYSHMDHYLCHSFLWRLMKRADSNWETMRRGFDGIDAEPQYHSPGRLRLCGEIAWVEENYYFDPFNLELELSPTTGDFRSYVIRFGDHRPLTEKKAKGAAKLGIPIGAWAYVFEHRAQLTA